MIPRENGKPCEWAGLAPSARRALLAWYGKSRRDLPWRRRRDPWRVWVSEVMLQQTRVEAVVEPYKRFIRKFPTLAAMAKACEDDVLAEWSGLGYYRRARMLHAGACYVAAHHAGRVPRSREALEKIPGIGSYTAAAILAIAFGEREAALDANVLRVVSRLGAVRDSHSADGRAQVGRLAKLLVDCVRPGEVNEALMDLGSTVCTARDAHCERCPLARICKARATGTPLVFAASRTRKAPRQVELACAVVADEDRVLLLRRSRAESLLGGLWELPTIDIGEHSPAIAIALKKLIRSRASLDVSVSGPLFRVRHDIVGRRIVAAVYEARIRGPIERGLPDEARMLAADGRRRHRHACPSCQGDRGVLERVCEVGSSCSGERDQRSR